MLATWLCQAKKAGRNAGSPCGWFTSLFGRGNKEAKETPTPSESKSVGTYLELDSQCY